MGGKKKGFDAKIGMGGEFLYRKCSGLAPLGGKSPLWSTDLLPPLPLCEHSSPEPIDNSLSVQVLNFLQTIRCDEIFIPPKKERICSVTAAAVALVAGRAGMTLSCA